MKMDFLRVFEDIKENDILFGGKTNLAVQNNLYPFIDFSDENAANSYRYLLIQFEFYIFHVSHCYDKLLSGETELELLRAGYNSHETESAVEAIKKYGDDFNPASYIYIANSKIGSIARAIEKILTGADISGIPEEIVKAARRRIAYSERGRLINEK